MRKIIVALTILLIVVSLIQPVTIGATIGETSGNITIQGLYVNSTGTLWQNATTASPSTYRKCSNTYDISMPIYIDNITVFVKAQYETSVYLYIYDSAGNTLYESWELMPTVDGPTTFDVNLTLEPGTYRIYVNIPDLNAAGQLYLTSSISGILPTYNYISLVSTTCDDYIAFSVKGKLYDIQDIVASYTAYNSTNTTYVINLTSYVMPIIPNGYSIINITRSDGVSVTYTTSEYNSTHYLLNFTYDASYNYTVYATAKNSVYSMVYDEYVPLNSTVQVQVYLKDPFGNPISNQVISYYVGLSDTPYNGTQSLVDYANGTVTSDENGIGVITFTSPTTDKYVVVQAETDGTYAGIGYIQLKATNISWSINITDSVVHQYLYDSIISVNGSAVYTIDNSPVTYNATINDATMQVTGSFSLNLTVGAYEAGPYNVSYTLDLGPWGEVTAYKIVPVKMVFSDFIFYTSEYRNITDISYDPSAKVLKFTTYNTFVNITVPSDLGKPWHVFIDGSEVFEDQYWWWDDTTNTLKIYVPYSNVEVYWSEPTTTTQVAGVGGLIILPIVVEEEEETVTTTVYVFNATAVTQVIVVDNQTYTITFWIHQPPHGLAEQLFILPVYVKIGVMMGSIAITIVLVIFLFRKT